MSTIEIVKKRKIPPVVVHRPYYYPFPEMAVGDSFDRPILEYRKVSCAAYRYGKKTGTKFTIRKSADQKTVGVWRIE